MLALAMVGPAAAGPRGAPDVTRVSVGGSAGAVTVAQAVAGRALSVRFPVHRSDTGDLLTGGTVCCEVSALGKPVASRTTLAGAARVDLVVPKAAKGKLLRVAVTVTFGGNRATRIATFRVR